MSISFRDTPPEALPAVADHPEDDSLLERWLARAPSRKIRIASTPPPIPYRTAPLEPIGDDVADAWFK